MRNLYAKLINSPTPECIAFAPSTAFAMSLAAANLTRLGKIPKGKCVLVLASEMASNVYPWQHACQLTGATLVVVPAPVAATGQTWASQIISYLAKGNVCVLSVGMVHWCDGTFIDLIEISAAIRRLPTPPPFFSIDGTQSIGAMPMDLSVIQPDFCACSIHKWLLSPHGASIMYLSASHHAAWLPLDQHERARVGADSVYWDAHGTLADGTTLQGEFHLSPDE